MRQIARYSVGKDPEAMASFLTGAGDEDPREHMRAILPVIRPVVALQMRTSEDDRAGVPGGAAGRSSTASTRCSPRA